MCFDANNDEQKKQFHNILENNIKVKLSAKQSVVEGSLDTNIKIKNEKNNSSELLNKIEN